MCRSLYTVFLATLLSFIACRSQAEDLPAERALDPRRSGVDQQAALELQLRDAQTQRGEQRLVGPVVLVSVGVPLLLGSLGGMALAGFAAKFRHRRWRYERWPAWRPYLRGQRDDRRWHHLAAACASPAACVRPDDS